MSLNAVNNNAPAAHAIANAIDFTVNEMNAPAPKAPPGSVGHQLNAIKSQLYSGNPGGVGAGFGLGTRSTQGPDVVQNLVLNNSLHNFSVHWDALRADDDQPKVIATPGTDAAVMSDLRAELASGALVNAGAGIHAEHSA